MARQFIKDRVEIGRYNVQQQKNWFKTFGIIPFLVLMIGSWVSAIISLVIFIDTLSIITNFQNNINTNTPKNISFSSTESVSLALLAAALAVVMFLLVKPRIKSNKKNTTQGIPIIKSQPTAKITGISFIVSAMALALFSLLIPFLNAVSGGGKFFPNDSIGNFCDLMTKWVSFISLMIGTTCLAMPLSFGPFLFAVDWLRKREGKVKQT